MNLYLRERTLDNIKPAERFVLDTLRATELKKMRDDDWSGLERRVAQVGLKNVDGWYGDQLRKAIRTLVEKHPGHGDQSVHGSGKKGGSAPAPSDAPSGGGSAPRKGESKWVAETRTNIGGRREVRMEESTKAGENLNVAGRKILGGSKEANATADKMEGYDTGTTKRYREIAQQSGSAGVRLKDASKAIKEGQAYEKIDAGTAKAIYAKAHSIIREVHTQLKTQNVGKTAKSAIPDLELAMASMRIVMGM